MTFELSNLTMQLAATAGECDATGAWPEDAMTALRDAGALRWIVPEAYGGRGLAVTEQSEAYMAVAEGSLAVALLLTQRDGACDLIASGTNEGLKQWFLPPHARGERFGSIGISQLTTSKGRGKPKMSAECVEGGFVLEGVMPWVSGAAFCDDIVTGAVLPDGRQILACVDCRADGITIEPPMRFMALDASHTTRVICERVFVPAERVAHGPAEKALARRSPVKSLTVAAVGCGMIRALQAVLGAALEASSDELEETVAPAVQRGKEAIELVRAAAVDVTEDGELPQSKSAIRVRVNEALIQLALAALTASKGSGFLAGKPSERLLREAMFFLVWSAPDDVRVGSMQRLLGSAAPDASSS